MSFKKDRDSQPTTTSKAAETPVAAAVTSASKPAATAPASTPVAASVPTVSTPVAVAAKPVAAPVAAAVAVAAKSAVAVAEPRTEVRDRSSIVILIEKLRNSDAEVARDAAVTLGNLPADAEAVDALCTVIRNRESYFHPVVRAAAAASLGKLGDRRAVDALVEATRDTMAEASEEAVKALGLLNDPRALNALQLVVQNRDGFFLENVRRSAEEVVRRLSQQSTVKVTMSA